MKLQPLFTAAFGGGAKLLGTASSLAIVVGAIYLVDCRLNSKGAEGIDRCYLSALPMMGLGAGVGGGFMAGFNTYNPALRPEDGPTGSDRDERGRFKGRQP
jgi:hypothetical protein